MRVGDGAAEEGVDPVDQHVGDGVLHVFGLFVDLVPGEVEGLGEKGFEQPVATQHPEGERPPSGGEGDAGVGGVTGQATVGEGLEHAGDGPRRDPHRGGQLPGGHALLVFGKLQLQNRLQVVFNSQAGHGKCGGED